MIGAQFTFVLVAISGAGFEYNNRGMQVASQNQFETAVSFYNRGIQIWRDLGPEFEAHLATTEVNLAQTLSAIGDREAAIRNLSVAVAQFRHSLGADHLRSATALNLLGANYLMLGDDANASAAFSQALAVERRLYPTDC